jgi:hypothetical protein
MGGFEKVRVWWKTRQNRASVFAKRTDAGVSKAGAQAGSSSSGVPVKNYGRRKALRRRPVQHAVIGNILDKSLWSDPKIFKIALRTRII